MSKIKVNCKYCNKENENGDIFVNGKPFAKFRLMKKEEEQEEQEKQEKQEE